MGHKLDELCPVVNTNTTFLNQTFQYTTAGTCALSHSTDKASPGALDILLQTRKSRSRASHLLPQLS